MGKRIFSKIRYVLLFLLVLAIPTITGADWTAMESGTTYELRGVWSSSATDVYAVGIGGVIPNYDGNTEGSWSPMQNSSPWPKADKLSLKKYAFLSVPVDALTFEQ